MPNKWISIAAVLVALFVGQCALRAQTKAASGTPASPAKAQTNIAAPDLSGNWAAAPHESNNSFSLTDPSGAKVGTPEDDTPYQPWALAKLRNERPEAGRNSTFLNTTDPRVKYCDPVGIPRIFLIPNQFKFVQTPDLVYILFEYSNVWYPVAMNKPHSSDPDPSWWGESVGHYEGDTLVVDSIGFNDKTWLDRVGRPHSEDLHLVERFRRVTRDSLQLDVTFDDLKAYTKVWTGRRMFALSTTPFEDRSCSMSEYEHFKETVIDPVVAPPASK
jgi:hypothetical protein